MSDTPQINFNTIDFPSDHLTLKQLRALIPDLENRVEDLDLMHMREREFSRLGFAREVSEEATQRGVEQTRPQWSDWGGWLPHFIPNVQAVKSSHFAKPENLDSMRKAPIVPPF